MSGGDADCALQCVLVGTVFCRTPVVLFAHMPLSNCVVTPLLLKQKFSVKLSSDMKASSFNKDQKVILNLS